MGRRWLLVAFIGAVWGLGSIGIQAWAQGGDDSGSTPAEPSAAAASETAPASEEPVPAEPSEAAASAETASEEAPADAEEEEASGPSASDLKVMADTVWTLVAGFLVFWMNAGFGCVEAGFCRAKNATNILGKNFVVFGISSLAFWAIGFAIMFGDGDAFAGASGWFLAGADNSPTAGDAYAGVYSSLNWTGTPLLAKFFFQLVFAGTAATIVSGCVAERIHYGSYMLFVVFLVGLSYPITGHWIWGGGWLSQLSDLIGLPAFQDFAGSTVVHSVGGWAGLIGILLLGPRIGKYRSGGGVQPIPGHSMALAFLGGLILWLGWFGFNPGSFMAADSGGISHVVVTTNLACAAGLISATLTAWIVLGKPDFSMTVNGALAGLVAITAPCAFVAPWASAVIGLAAGVFVVGSVIFFDKIRVDDPVGALSVHLTNGIWGTLSVGLFAYSESPGGLANGLFYGGGWALLGTQVIGVAAVGAFTMLFSLIAWALIKLVVGMRVEAEAEFVGLDLSEMGMEAYPVDPLAPLGAVGVGGRPAVQSAGLPPAEVPLELPHRTSRRAAPAIKSSRHSRSVPRFSGSALGAGAGLGGSFSPGFAHGGLSGYPSPIPAGGRFRLQIENVEPRYLRERWRELCANEAAAPPEFKDVFPKVTAFQGNVIHFREGDPEEIRHKVHRLFQGYSPGMEVQVYPD